MTRARAVVLFVLLFTVFGALRASYSREVGGDFLRYHRAGRLVATGDADRIYDPGWIAEQRVYAAERTEESRAIGAAADDYPEGEFKYLPAAAVLMAPVGALHPRTGWIVWGAWNGLMIALAVAAAWDFAGRGTPWRWALLPAVALLRTANDNMNLGQVNPSAIAPAVVAVWALDRGRDRLAGCAAGFGAAVKFLPGLLVLFFLLKRRFVAAAVTVAVFVAVGWGLPAVALGAERAARLNAEYRAAREHVYTEAAPRDVPGHSVKSFVYRVFGGIRYRTGGDAHRAALDVSVAHADPESLRVAVHVVVLLLGCVVAWAVRGPLRGAGDARGPPEAGIFFCWMLLASPEARAPHFLYLILPAFAVTALLMRAWRETWACRRTATVLAVAAALLLATESRSLVGRAATNLLSAWCAPGWAALAVLVALVLLAREAARRAAAGSGGPASHGAAAPSAD